MAVTELQIITSGVPEGLCYTNPTYDLQNIIAPYLRARFSGSEINTGSSTPAAADRTKPWIRTNSDGTDDGTWSFYAGYWVQKHPMAVGAIILWEGALTDIDAFDGGETAAVTNISGPFWERATGFDARSPMGPGTLPISSTVVNVGDAFGEERHTQVIAEIGTHRHEYSTADSQQVLVRQTTGKVGDINQTGSLDYAYSDQMDTTGSSTPFNVVHPVRICCFLRRTARLYRRRVA